MCERLSFSRERLSAASERARAPSLLRIVVPAALGALLLVTVGDRLAQAYVGVLLLLTVLAFNLVGDGLRDAFDPKMKR